MSSFPRKRTIKKSWLYAIALFLYPFSVLFSPLINFRVINARIDEIVILLCVPIVILNWRRSTYSSELFTIKIVGPYMLLFLLFCWGILWGNSFERLDTSYLRQYVFRPLYLLFVILAVNSVLRRTRMNKNIMLVFLLASLCLAGLLGFIAMRNPSLSMLLIRLYNPHLEFNIYLQSAFNMSFRAMSVFAGYEQASVAYGFGFIIAMAMIIFMNKKLIYKLFLVGLMAVFFIFMLSSARTGLVSIIGGGSLLLFFLPTRNKRYSKLFLILIVLAFISSWSSIFSLFPTNETGQRFADLLNIFDTDRSTNFLQRSEGVSGLVQGQILAPTYPRGADMVFGFGDSMEFVSDIAYVSFFVKYGLIGLLVAVCVFFCWVSFGTKIINYGLRRNIRSDLIVSSYILPCVAVLFAIAAAHGHFYFLSIKTGELVSFFLGIVLFEYQSIISYEIKI